jgi:hypothetical protein
LTTKFSEKIGISKYLGKYWAGAEAMYSVIIVMTFTSTLRAAANEGQYEFILLSALYCCIAWGLADGFFYAWEDVYNSKSHELLIEDAKVEEKKPTAVSKVKEELDDTIIGSIEENDRTKLYEGIVGYLSKNKLSKEEKNTFLRTLPHYLLGTSVLSVSTGLIVLLPFAIFPHNLNTALPLSRIIAIVTLFAVGYYRSQSIEFYRRLSSGILSALVGVIIALITVALGG